MRILAISGSLRAASFNTMALRAAQRLLPAGIEFVRYQGLADLPAFNPDREGINLPPPVRALRMTVGQADGLLICSPEYAHGIAGALKNALDWLVGSLEFPGKPVAVINTSHRATIADGQLRGILLTMSARLIEPASIRLPLLGKDLTAEAIVADKKLAAQLCGALEIFVTAIKGELAQPSLSPSHQL